MSTGPHQLSNRESIINCNAAIARRFGVTLRVYKTIKATTQFIGVAAGILAMQQGADPMTVFVIIGGIIFGPEAMETVLSNTNSGD